MRRYTPQRKKELLEQLRQMPVGQRREVMVEHCLSDEELSEWVERDARGSMGLYEGFINRRGG